jgi:uncharacterized membrane protein YbhN (UPF0104 family)
METKTRSQTILHFLRHVLSLVLVFSLLFYLYLHWHIFLSIITVSWLHIISLVVCVIATWGLNSLQALILFRMERIQIGFSETFLIQTATILLNYLPMRAGTILRFHYFKNIYGLMHTRLLGIIALRLLFLFSATGLMGCIALLGLRSSGDPVSLFLWLVFLGMLLVPAGLWLAFIKAIHLPDNAFGKVAHNVLSASLRIKTKPNIALDMLLIILGQFIILAMRFFIVFNSFQIMPSIWVLLLLAPVSTVLSIITITPGNLGLREWIIGLLSLASGYPFDAGLMAGTLDRAVQMACTFLLGGISACWVWFRLQTKSYSL